MSEIIDALIQDDIKYLTELLQEDGERIKTKADELLYNFDQYIKTGDTTFLQNEIRKNNHVEENFPAKTVQHKKRVLGDITEKSIPIQVEIKHEKISDVFSTGAVASLTTVSERIDECNVNSRGQSNTDEMPPPKKLPPRKRKIKEEPLDMPKRSTRTRKKTIRYTANEKYSSVPDVIIQNQTIPIVDITDESSKDAEYVRKETASEISIANETQPVRSKRTRTLRKTKRKSNELQKEPITNKQTDSVSSFEKVPKKTKVGASETLLPESNNSPAMNTGGNKQPIEQQQNCTPTISKVATKVHGTTKHRFLHRGDTPGNNSIVSVESQSALKASQAEFREGLRKKQEKEHEALKKSEALLLALTEEKRKKREEKQLKAQQQKELREKQKLKRIEARKLRDEKHKQALAEREEKQKKEKGEAKRKILLVNKRAEALKNRDPNQSPNLPVYITSEAPLLPTDDCYDSDDEDSKRLPHKDIPDWSRDLELEKMQHVILMIGEKLKNTFFSRQVHTPDLQEIFEKIDPRKLKRTSSALWRKPPRYTFFLESSSVQFSDDDEEH